MSTRWRCCRYCRAHFAAARGRRRREAGDGLDGAARAAHLRGGQRCACVTLRRGAAAATAEAGTLAVRSLPRAGWRCGCRTAARRKPAAGRRGGAREGAGSRPYEARSPRLQRTRRAHHQRPWDNVPREAVATVAAVGGIAPHTNSASSRGGDGRRPSAHISILKRAARLETRRRGKLTRFGACGTGHQDHLAPPRRGTRRPPSLLPRPMGLMRRRLQLARRRPSALFTPTDGPPSRRVSDFAAPSPWQLARRCGERPPPSSAARTRAMASPRHPRLNVRLNETSAILSRTSRRRQRPPSRGRPGLDPTRDESPNTFTIFWVCMCPAAGCRPPSPRRRSLARPPGTDVVVGDLVAARLEAPRILGRSGPWRRACR